MAKTLLSKLSKLLVFLLKIRKVNRPLELDTLILYHLLCFKKSLRRQQLPVS